jgi:hypothetical protein
MVRAHLPVFLAGLFCAAILFLTAVVHAGEVRLKKGQTLFTQQVVFNGMTGRFEFFAKGNRISMPAGDVYLIRMSEGDLTSLTARLGSIEKEKQQQAKRIEKSDRDLQSAKEEIKRLTMRNKELSDEKARYDQEQGAARGQEETIRQLQSEKEKLVGNNNMLSEQIEILKRRQTAPPEAPVAELPAMPEIQNCSFTKDPSRKFLVVKGTSINKTAQVYSDVVVEIAAYDKAGNLLGMTNTFISNFGPGQTRPFRGDLEADLDAVTSVTARTSAAFPSAGR